MEQDGADRPAATGLKLRQRFGRGRLAGTHPQCPCRAHAARAPGPGRRPAGSFASENARRRTVKRCGITRMRIFPMAERCRDEAHHFVASDSWLSCANEFSYSFGTLFNLQALMTNRATTSRPPCCDRNDMYRRVSPVSRTASYWRHHGNTFF